MDAQSDPLDTQIARVARSQQGNIHLSQLRTLGATRHMITTRVKRGSLFREHPCVYSVGKPATTPREKASAAVLACGARSTLGLRSALANWEFIPRWPDKPQVLTAGRARPKGIQVHKCTTLLRSEVIEHHGILTTTPARTLLDVAPLLNAKELDRVVTTALLSVYVNTAHLQHMCEKHPDHPGAKLLEQFWNTADGPVRSNGERELKAFRKQFGFTTMIINVNVRSGEVDGYIPEARLIIELDGWITHRSEFRFEDDREGDADNLDADVETYRLTKKRLRGQPVKEAERIHRIAARRARYFLQISAGPAGTRERTPG